LHAFQLLISIILQISLGHTACSSSRHKDKSKDRQNVTRNTMSNHLTQEVNITSRCVKPCNVDCWSLVPTICLCILDSWSLEEPTHHTPTPCHTWDCLKVNVDNICCKLQLKHFNYWN